MKQRFKRILLSLVLWVLWGFLLLVQHIAAFDVFETNLWYLYLIAAGSAVLHYFALLLLKKLSKSSFFLLLCGALYAVCACGKFLQLCTVHFYQPYPLGLTILCLVLDSIGVIITALAIWKAKKSPFHCNAIYDTL